MLENCRLHREFVWKGKIQGTRHLARYTVKFVVSRVRYIEVPLYNYHQIFAFFENELLSLLSSLSQNIWKLGDPKRCTIVWRADAKHTNTYETRKQNDLQVPRPSLEKFRKNFSCIGTKLWNKIPNVRDAVHNLIFKKRFRNYIFLDNKNKWKITSPS